ncbi:S-adenosylmethionine:tRNA ribosyltransferase-isomerase [subsurface metagenome]
MKPLPPKTEVKTSDFYFDIPDRLIAQQPSPDRGISRLMILKRCSGQVLEATTNQLADYIAPDTVVVLNDTRVRKARLYGNAHKNGGRVEFLLLEELKPGLWKALVSKSKKQRPGKTFHFPGGMQGMITGSEGHTKYIQFHPPINDRYLEAHGHIPLPPYIKRKATAEDEQRYQTIYARSIGSAAAPTAGLHLTSEVLDSLKEKGIEVAAVTLHVGLGTFLPIRTPNIEEHTMHKERYSISRHTAQLINKALKSSRKIMAVGTTVVRALETACPARELMPGEGRTDIFIYPGYRFKVVSQLLTNFHTPGSTLLILVSALAGRQKILSAYREAVRRGYRFFSYGDAMLIL